jgi:hypothetical protein
MQTGRTKGALSITEPAKVTTEVSEEGSNSVGTGEGYERSSRDGAGPTKASDIYFFFF